MSSPSVGLGHNQINMNSHNNHSQLGLHKRLSTSSANGIPPIDSQKMKKNKTNKEKSKLKKDRSHSFVGIPSDNLSVIGQQADKSNF